LMHKQIPCRGFHQQIAGGKAEVVCRGAVVFTVVGELEANEASPQTDEACAGGLRGAGVVG
jgi:hypothetical protein